MRSDLADIGIPDMPFIRPGMYGNALGSELLATHSGFQDIRNIPPAGIPNCCNFVYIYA
jgi:hypothetical protein